MHMCCHGHLERVWLFGRSFFLLQWAKFGVFGCPHSKLVRKLHASNFGRLVALFQVGHALHASQSRSKVSSRETSDSVVRGGTSPPEHKVDTGGIQY
jgi:hypothetical protein